MHTPGHNPFISQVPSGQTTSVDAILQYLTGLGQSDYESYGTTGASTGVSGQYTFDYPQYGTTTQSFDVNLPMYQYQGISPEISQALQNVFTLGSGETFNPLQFGEEFITSQILEQLPESIEGQLTSEDIDATLANLSGINPNIVGVPDDLSPTLEGIEGLSFDSQTTPLQFTNIFDPESLAATLSQLSGTPDSIKPGEVKALTPEQLEKTTAEYYDPLEDAERQSLVERLAKATGQAATGGFAGSGARQAGLSGAERLYRGGYQDLLSDIMKMRAGATEDVLDTIYGYQELLSGVSGQ